MYRTSCLAADTQSRRIQPLLAPTLVPRHGTFPPVPRPGAFSAAPAPRPVAFAAATLPQHVDLEHLPHPHPALHTPAMLISTPTEELGFPPAAFDGRTTEEGLIDEHFEEEDGYNGAIPSGYFTDLLVNDVGASQIPAHHSDPINNEASAATKSSQGRTRNFNYQEDILLVSAWLNVGMDPIQGVDQTHGTYWARIYEYFHTNKEFESTRTEVSLINRWSTIQHDVNTFCGCLTRIQGLNKRGYRIDDKIADACTMYKVEDKKNRKFSLMHCWNILKDKPKWIERRKDLGGGKKSSSKK